MRCLDLAALALAVATIGGGCGGPSEASPKPKSPEEAPFAISRRVEVTELIPPDVDTIVRVDIGRLRATLGPQAMAVAAKQLAGDPLMAEAFARARIVTVALRARDLERGDRVVAIEGDMAAIVPDERTFEKHESINERAEIYERRGEGKADETGLVVVLDERAAVFASMTETDGVLAMIRGDREPSELEPKAEGVFSVAHRSRALSAALAKKYPSISRILGHVREVRAQVDVDAEGAILRAEITTDGDAGAERVEKFFRTLKEGALGPKGAATLETLTFERTGASLALTWRVPAALLMGWLADADADPRDAPLPGSAP